MSLRVLTIGDLHVKVANIEESLLLSSILCSIAEAEEPDLIVVLGDTLHDFSLIHTQAQEVAVNMIHALTTIANVILLIGNHDIPTNTQFMSSTHGFTALKFHPHVKVVDTKCLCSRVNGIRIACVPYAPPGRFMDALQTNSSFSLERIDVIFAHQQFKGCLDPNYTSMGDEWNKNYPYVISGHIHKSMMIGKNINYVGTPRQTDFGDVDVIKTVSLFTFCKNSEGVLDIQEKKIVIPLPPKMTFDVKCKRIGRWNIPENVIISRNCIRIRLEGTTAEIVASKAHPKVKMWKSKGVKIIEVIDNNKTNEDIQTRLKNLTEDTNTVSFRAELIKRFSTNPRYVELYQEL